MEATSSGEHTPNNNNVTHQQQRSTQNVRNSNSRSYINERRQMLTHNERERIHSMTQQRRQSYLARRRSNYRRRQDNDRSSIPDESNLGNSNIVAPTTMIQQSPHNIGENLVDVTTVRQTCRSEPISFHTLTSNYERGSSSTCLPRPNSVTQGFQRRKKLTMMVIHNIFVPEDWSFTFFEGLNRHPDSILKYKTVTELGCGNGWISISIAEKWSHLKVYGLHINPRPVKISWINLYFNSLDENGQPIYEGQKKTLLDRVEFHEFDLLSYCRDKHLELDRIVGCIRQFLNPNPDAMSKMITENASDEFLHSLSNYCALQFLNHNPDAMSKMIIENASDEFLHSLSNYCALQGFPSSVTPDYAPFQLWDSLQGLSTYMRIPGHDKF
ncbi:uncharacterized protein [Primulina eburnea]|uniref:uncharacterized protein isoform X2 n=1 Tax=Primulina eburnea TaxID=1245227 RepID=UPI003C6BF713